MTLIIPRVANLDKVEANYAKFLQALADHGFKGEIEDRYAARLLVATDNSVYQKMPQAVVFPRDKHDVVTIFKTANDPQFKSIVLTPRGGGTGTNGQSLSRGVIIDMSRHMKGVSDFDPANRTIWVQSGVIKDELNELVGKEQLFFSPELSTSSRATIGGMIANDAAGQGSLKYGRTSEHILEVEVVLRDGSLCTFKPVNKEELKECLNRPGLEGEIYQKCYALLKEHADEVKQNFPKLNRFLTGYDLFHAYDKSTDTLNLARLICGAEGTLATLVGAKIDLTLKPSYRALCVVKYENFDSALRHANVLIKAGAFSVETVDSRVLNLAKKDPVWLTVQNYITEVPDATISGVNIVEFNGYDVEADKALMVKLFEKTQKEAKKRHMGILGAQIVDTKEGIAAVYGMRKKAVGLLGSAAGAKKLVAFTEDTVVPPENLADYILEFRALLDSMNVTYGMFGHVDTGLMHVRPALDLTTDEDKQKLVAISNGVVELVKKYGGQMWGEHGRGYRSCYGEVFFGKLYPVARQIKAIFDPNNILNPGKICVPWGNEKDKLVALDDPMRGDFDRKIDIKVRTSFEGALNCNGNGQCFSYQRASLMCPSYRYSKDHVKSPKGYSGLMREWLRLMEERKVDINGIEEQLLSSATQDNASLGAKFANSCSYLGNLVKRTYNTIFDKEDFNHEYLGHVATCLSCKSCKTQCPAHVNSAELNSRFLNFYYSRYLRPSMDFLCMNAERTNPWLALRPKFANAILQSSLNKLIMDKLFKFVDLPKFNERTLKQQANDEAIAVLSIKEAQAKAAHYDVIVVANAFTGSYEADGLVDLAKLIRLMGFRVAILKPYTNGKLLVIRGARAAFIKEGRKQAERLASLYSKGLTLVGFDPALTICYRDEYPSLIPNCPEFKVLLPEEWLKEALVSEQFKRKEQVFINELNNIIAQAKSPAAKERLAFSQAHTQSEDIAPCDYSSDFYLFCHCTEQALVPLSVKMWQEVLAHFNLRLLPIPVACCGMAGLFGHMKANQDESRVVYEQNWQEHFKSRPFAQCLVTGFSCRSQVHRMENQRANHPIHVLAQLLEQATKQAKARR